MCGVSANPFRLFALLADGEDSNEQALRLVSKKDRFTACGDYYYCR